MTIMEAVRTDSYHVSSFSVDAAGKLSLPVLFAFFQESAYRHAESLQFGYSQLGERKQFWVLSRLRIQSFRFPSWGEDIAVTTWPKGTSRMFALRDFLVTDAGGEKLFAATSSWLVLDTETRRVQRIEHLFDGHELPRDRHALREEAGKIGSPVQPTVSSEFSVSYGDIDVNSHMNNTRYVQLVLDSYPLEHFRTREVSLLEINFLAETLYGDQARILSSYGSPAAPEREDLHLFSRVQDERELCRVRTVWKETAVS